MDESQALTTAIGEYSLSNLGKENLSGLQVIFNPREATAFVTIALRDRSTEAQRSAIETMYDVADVYDDEATLEFVFVEHISDTIEANSMVPQYSYA